MEEFKVREARFEDAPQVLEYLKIIGGETENLTFGAEGLPITAEQEGEFLESVYNNPTSLHLIVCKGGEIIGDGGLTGLPRRMSHRAEVGLSVKKAYWNCGIGSMILKELIEYAKKSGIELLNLEVRSDNLRAIHLYEKFGFRKIGTSPAFFKINGEYADVDLMYLDLR